MEAMGDHEYAIEDILAAGDPEALFQSYVDEDPGVFFQDYAEEDLGDLYQEDHVDEDQGDLYQEHVDEDQGDLYQDHVDEDLEDLYQDNVDEVQQINVTVFMPVIAIPLLIPVFVPVPVPVPVQSNADQQRVSSPIVSSRGVNVGQSNTQVGKDARGSALCCSATVLESEPRPSTSNASVSTETKGTLSRKRRRCPSDDGSAVGSTPQEAEDRPCVPTLQEDLRGVVDTREILD
ncbi:uncharacterized protein LOC121711633 isoform X2 [Alosa sapidissima]|nr:uncharacterized protein LOC121711633 isoform X2 [Alosa sapidissima]